MDIEKEKASQWIQRLISRGLTGPAAFHYLEQAQHEALRRLLIQKNLIEKEEIDKSEERVIEEFVEKAEKMSPLPK